MALTLPLPKTAWATLEVSIAGLTYDFEYKFNERDLRWRLSIYLEGEVVISSVKLVENTPLLGRFLLEDFSHGELVCVRMKDDKKEAGRDNIGFDLPYELMYFSNEELGV